MKEKAKGKMCAVRSCSISVTTHPYYCNKHRWLSEKPQYKFEVSKDEWRQKAKRFYRSRKWKLLRKEVLKEFPFCDICKLRMSEDVHHLEPLRNSWEKRLDKENLQALCHSCHSRITSEKTLWNRKIKQDKGENS